MKKDWNRDALISLFQENANAADAKPMKAYMKDKFDFLGIRSPLRKQLFSEFFAMYQFPEDDQFLSEVRTIYHLPEREFQYIAIEMLTKQRKKLSLTDLAFLADLITTKSWWDSVDAIAPKIVGTIILQNREDGERIMKQWSNLDNLWLNRSALLHQLKYKGNTNEELLFEMIRSHVDSNEFFIQKAIGWVLREYAKTSPDHVRSFVESTNLKPLSRREALKHIKGV